MTGLVDGETRAGKWSAGEEGGDDLRTGARTRKNEGGYYFAVSYKYSFLLADESGGASRSRR